MKTSTRLANEWARRSFGEDQMTNFGTRALRIAEEAVELAQAHEITREKMHELVDIVYNRPVGDPVQELGGVAMTAELMAAMYGLDLEDFFVRELSRVLAKPTSHFAQRNADKEALGLKV